MAKEKSKSQVDKETLAFIKEVGIGPALVQRLGEFNALMGRVLEHEQKIVQQVGTVVAPKAELIALTGELRAIRQMMDKEGKYLFMDQVKQPQT